MHGHHESWFTALLNQFLAAPANAVYQLIGKHPHDAARPWPDWLGTEIFAALVIMILAALLRSRLSMDRPGTLQHMFEGLYGMFKSQAQDVIGHDGHKHIYFAGTLFLFIVVMNLLGLVPAFESPTMFPWVPLGCAICTFVYYNFWGIKVQGIVGYLKHFAGPMWWLAWFMFPLEIISHLIRPVSLTIRLYANMLAGEQVTIAFLGLVPFALPVVVMGLHTFVSLLQAFIFMLLTMSYVSLAIEHEEH